MKQNLTLRIIVSAAAVLLAIAHIWRPDIQIDSITIVLLVICVLPWLQPLIKSIELLGVKLELQDLQEKVTEARGAAESAYRQAGLALSVSSGVETSARSRSVTAPVGAPAIESLAHEYERIREAQRSGDARTAAMTDVVRRMIEAARDVESFDVRTALRSDSAGMRLFAYAYLYTRPDTQALLPLVEAVTTRESTPFGQYWGLQSVGRVISSMERIPEEAKDRLQLFGAKLKPGTDRDYELKKILRQIG